MTVVLDQQAAASAWKSNPRVKSFAIAAGILGIAYLLWSILYPVIRGMIAGYGYSFDITRIVFLVSILVVIVGAFMRNRVVAGVGLAVWAAIGVIWVVFDIQSVFSWSLVNALPYLLSDLLIGAAAAVAAVIAFVRGAANKPSMRVVVLVLALLSTFSSAAGGVISAIQWGDASILVSAMLTVLLSGTLSVLFLYCTASWLTNLPAPVKAGQSVVSTVSTAAQDALVLQKLHQDGIISEQELAWLQQVRR